MHIKKAYTFRLDPNLIKQLDTFDNSRTYNINLAIQNYIQSGFTSTYSSNTEVIQLLKEQVNDLKTDKDLLQKRLDYFMLPWYHRLLLPKPIER